jgi:hypothetical protein
MREAGIGAVLSVNDGLLCHPEDFASVGIHYARIPLSENAPPQPGDDELCRHALPQAHAFVREQLRQERRTAPGSIWRITGCRKPAHRRRRRSRTCGASVPSPSPHGAGTSTRCRSSALTVRGGGAGAEVGLDRCNCVVVWMRSANGPGPRHSRRQRLRCRRWQRLRCRRWRRRRAERVHARRSDPGSAWGNGPVLRQHRLRWLLLRGDLEREPRRGREHRRHHVPCGRRRLAGLPDRRSRPSRALRQLVERRLGWLRVRRRLGGRRAHGAAHGARRNAPRARRSFVRGARERVRPLAPAGRRRKLARRVPGRFRRHLSDLLRARDGRRRRRPAPAEAHHARSSGPPVGWNPAPTGYSRGCTSTTRATRSVPCLSTAETCSRPGAAWPSPATTCTSACTGTTTRPRSS